MGSAATASNEVVPEAFVSIVADLAAEYPHYVVESPFVCGGVISETGEPADSREFEEVAAVSLAHRSAKCGVEFALWKWAWGLPGREQPTEYYGSESRTIASISDELTRLIERRVERSDPLGGLEVVLVDPKSGSTHVPVIDAKYLAFPSKLAIALFVSHSKRMVRILIDPEVSFWFILRWPYARFRTWLDKKLGKGIWKSPFKP